MTFRPIKGLYSRSQIVKEENDKKVQEENDKKVQEEKTTGEPDLVDIAYSTFRRRKDKNYKLEEMRNYFASHNPRTPFPPPVPLDIFNYGNPNNLPTYHVDPTSSLTAPPVHKVPTKEGNRICGSRLRQLP